MLTNATTAHPPGTVTAWPAARKVVVVNSRPEVLEVLVAALAAGRYDLDFVESSRDAYSQIRRLQPGLIILCTSLEEQDGLQLLSMLKLDEATRGIPVVTYTAEYEGQDEEDDPSEAGDADLLPPPKRAWPMN